MKNRVIIIGPIFRSQTGFIGEGAKLYYKLQIEGYQVRVKSPIKNKLLRFLDILFYCIFCLKKNDVVLLQSYGLLAFYMEDAVSRICKYKNIPIVFTLHGGAFGEFYQNHKNWVTKTLKRANHITTPSMFLIDQLKELELPIAHLPNFIDLDRFKYNFETKVIHSLLWVRGFHEIYHPELAIETVEKLVPLFPDIHLTMIGKDQGLKTKCKELIKSKNLEKHITLLGYVDNKELSNYYNTHQVFLNTTRYESFGVSLIEAAACGLPIVSTKVGEIPYLWEDQKEMILSERNPQSFADAVAYLLQNPIKTKEIIESARVKTLSFSWEEVGPKWKNIINKMNSTCAE